MFVHHVYFWLKNSESVEDRAKLIAGLEKLTKIDGVKLAHIGQPADTDRGVIDRSYAISWLMLFDTKEAQDAYQVDPLHVQFVQECSSVWSKVIVYDSVNV